jgi:hypothetical protein
MMKASLIVCVFLLIALARTNVNAQQPESKEYGTSFFDQLGLIFGRFRDADLQHVFQTARPIRCSDLITEKGEWRAVGFFNENRKLGDWYRKSLDAVKHDLAVYVFKGGCDGPTERLQVTTKFPVHESIDAYEARKIRFDEIDVNVNAPVKVSYDPKTRAYTFDLPYLFRVPNQEAGVIYSLNPRHLSDRYATEVVNRWECKAVRADDVTYQFLICRNAVIPVEPPRNRREENRPFGALGYSILSDGKEASSTVKLTFGTSDDPGQNR